MIKQTPSWARWSLSSQMKRVVFVIALTLGLGSASLLSAAPTHAQSFGDTANTASSYGQNVSSCEIETVGWVVCPVMRSISKLADYGFAFINQNFLKIEYSISNSQSGVYKAWELMRTVANALFVLAFMAIVYAQITGRNAGGYSIKRMLPRLIIGAILVNISYYVCVIGIEVSNIVGGSILAIMQQVTDQIGQPAMTLTSAANGFDDSRLSDITNAVLTKTGTVWILLAPVAAVTVSIAIICAAGLVLLIMRKVVVAMLVLVSPLMFVTYLLPNTERYFSQWLRLLFQLLLLYPVIAFLLGTGQIISATIVNVGSGSDSNYRVSGDGYQGRNGGSGSITTDLAAAGAAVLPLLGTWFLLKAASSVVTNAGTKVAGTIGRRSKNEEAKIKAQMDNKAKQSVNGPGGLPTYERRPAFSRLRRRSAASFAEGLAAKEGGGGKAGSAAGSGTPSLFDRAIGNVNGKSATDTDAAKQAASEADAKVAQAEADQLKGELAGGIVAAAAEDKKKTAKDIFNNLNKTHQMDDKKSGGGGGGGGNGGENNSTQQAGTPGPKTPMNTSVPTGQTPPAQPTAPSGPQKIIAVPVQVDPSVFLKKDDQPATPDQTMIHPPSTEVENKAKERANKYLFNAQDDINKASDRLDAIKELRDKQRKADEERDEHKDDK